MRMQRTSEAERREPVARRELLAAILSLLVATASMAFSATAWADEPPAGPSDDSLLESGESPVGAWPQLGGGIEPDFDSLMDLIRNTIEPTTWSDVGGAGVVEPFAGGVYVDALGTLRPRVEQEQAVRLASLLEESTPTLRAARADRPSPLRKVSLTRLEREIQLRTAAGQPLDESMLVLAGLQRVQYVMIYPATGDVVLAGPAGNWRVGAQQRLVSTDTGRPVVRLDDLIALLRQMHAAPEQPLGCSITPTREGLAAAQAFLDSYRSRALRPGERDAWLAKLRAHLGQQEIDIYGIDPESRVAAILVEADYHMKLVGIGLEEGTLGVPSYLEMLTADSAGAPMDVLRWWFTLEYRAVQADPKRQAYQLAGRGVRVKSENELIEAGQRVHTGKSSLLNQDFAHRFTEHFEALAAKYPVYAELQNIFDLAMTVALIGSENLDERAGWHMSSFLDAEQHPLPRHTAPRLVDSVMNYRELDERHFVAAVSGGVSANPWPLVQGEHIAIDREGQLDSQYQRAEPHELPDRHWWWD